MAGSDRSRLGALTLLLILLACVILGGGMFWAIFQLFPTAAWQVATAVGLITAAAGVTVVVVKRKRS